VLPTPPTALRADAARNRRKLLQAAGRLFKERGVESVSLDDVVAAASVGKGTLYRIFGDKSGLAAALLDERERALQHEILAGTPPLGPGATPAERLAAFVRAYAHYVATDVELVRMSQTSRPGARFDTGSHQFWRAHLIYLLTDGGAARPRLAADVLLSAMTAEQIGYWTVREHQPIDALGRQLATLAQTLMAR
jgi:AcrR family transcriptional regulator